MAAVDFVPLACSGQTNCPEIFFSRISPRIVMTTEPTPTSAMTDVYPSPSETNHFSLAGLPQSRRASGTAGAVLSKSPPMKTPMTLQFGTDTQFLPSQEPAPKPPSSVRSTSTASSSGSGSSSSWSPPDVHQMRQDLTVKSVLNPFDYGIEVEMDGETHCQADANVDARMDGIDSPLASPFAAPGAGVGFGVSLDLDSLDYNPPHSPALPPLPLSPSGGFGFSHMHLFDAPSADPFSSLPPAAKVPPPAPRSSSSGGSDPVSNYQGSSTYSRSVASAGTELSDLYGGGEPLSGDAYGSDPYGAVAPHEDVKPALNNISPSDMSVAATAADKLDLDFDLDLDRGSGSGSGPRSLYHQAQLSYIPEMNPRSVDTVSAATTVNNAIPIAAATPSPLHPVPVPRGAPPPTLFHPAAPDSSSSHRLAHLIGEQYLPSAGGVCYVYSDGSAVPKTVNGEPVNASWGVTKAGKPRRRLAQACVACRDRKIKCEPDVPKCTQCRKGGKVCRYENAYV